MNIIGVSPSEGLCHAVTYDPGRRVVLEQFQGPDFGSFLADRDASDTIVLEIPGTPAPSWTVQRAYYAGRIAEFIRTCHPGTYDFVDIRGVARALEVQSGRLELHRKVYALWGGQKSAVGSDRAPGPLADLTPRHIDALALALASERLRVEEFRCLSGT